MRKLILIALLGLAATPAWAQQEPPKQVEDEPPVAANDPAQPQEVAQSPHAKVEPPQAVEVSSEAAVVDDEALSASEVAVEAQAVASSDVAADESPEQAEASASSDEINRAVEDVEAAQAAQDQAEKVAGVEDVGSDVEGEGPALVDDASDAERVATAEEQLQMERLEADLHETGPEQTSDAEAARRQAEFKAFLDHVRGIQVVGTLQDRAAEGLERIGGIVPGRVRPVSREGMLVLEPLIPDQEWTVAVRLFEDGKCKEALGHVDKIADATMASAEARYAEARIQICAGKTAEGRATLKELAALDGVVAAAARARLGLKEDAAPSGQQNEEEGQYLSQLLDAAKTRARKNPTAALEELDALHASLKVPWDKHRVRLAQAEILEGAGKIDEAGEAYLEVYRKTRGWKVNDSIEDRIESLERRHKKVFLTFGERIDRMRHLVSRGRYKEAKQVSIENAKIRKVGGAEVRGWTKYRLALQAERDKERGKAVELFEEADRLVKDPEVRPRIYFGWARALRRTNKDSAAIALYERLCAEYPSQSLCEESLYEAGRLLQYQDKHADAQAKFTEVIEKYPNGEFVSDALWRSAFSHYLTGQWDASIPPLERLRTEFGDLRDESELTLGLKATYWMGVAHLKAGRRGDARKVFQDTIDRGMLTWYGRLAATRMKEEGWRPDVRMPHGRLTARDLEDLASLMVPEHPRLELAGMLVRVGFFQEALRELRTQAAIHPVPDGANRMLAAVHLARGDAQWAHWTMKKYIEEAGPTEVTLRDWGTAFPLAYMDLAHRYGESAGVSPFLVQAIMRQESGFRPTVKSWAGAIGLMQLMPGTANWTAKTFMDNANFKKRDLLDPEKNVRLGSMYIRIHTAHAMDRVSLALAGYNAGAGALESWFKRYGTRELDAFVESITYQEARGYVRKVMTSYITYSALYGGQLLEIPLAMPSSLRKWGEIPEVDRHKHISLVDVPERLAAR